MGRKKLGCAPSSQSLAKHLCAPYGGVIRNIKLGVNLSVFDFSKVLLFGFGGVVAIEGVQNSVSA